MVGTDRFGDVEVLETVQLRLDLPVEKEHDLGFEI